MSVDKKVSELTELTVPNASDLLHIVDVSANESKKITASNLGIGGGANVIAYGADSTGATDSTTAFQAAIDSGDKVYVPYGTYIVENLTATSVSELCIVGEAGRWPTIKLRDDDSGGGLGQILVGTDINTVKLENLKFDGNQANSKSSDSNTNPLIDLTQTSAMAGVDGCRVTVKDVEFNESAGGYGHMRIAAYEASGSSYGEYERLDIHNVWARSWGDKGAFLTIRGACRTVYITNIDGRNDGQYGHVARGDGIGSNVTMIGISAEVSFNHYIENLYIDGVAMYRGTGALFMQMVRNKDIKNVTETETCINPYYDVSASAITSVDAGADTITATIPSGFVERACVRFTTTGTLPDPLVVNKVYFTKDVSGDTFKLSLTSGATAIDITDAGSGTHSIEWLGVNYSTSIKEDDCKYVPGSPGHSVYERIIVIDPTPHSAHAAFAVEESSAGTATPVMMKDSSLVGQARFPAYYTGQKHKLFRTRVGGSNGNYDVDVTGSPISWSGGDIVDCEFPDRSLSVSISRDTKIIRGQFAGGAAFQFSGDGCRLILEDNEFNAGDEANRKIDFTHPSSGQFDVYIEGNRQAVGNVKTLNFRRLSGGSDSAVTYFIRDNPGIDIDSFGAGRDVATQIVSDNNSSMRRANNLFPLATLADEATPSIIGVTNCVTGGTTAITDFDDGIDYQQITVFIASGHTVNDTASIVTRGGANISGPKVTKFIQYGSIWYEV